MTDQHLILSLDGNIGAGKSTLMARLQTEMPDIEFVLEPVAEWTTLKNAEGKSLLELFYEDKHRWAYTFQNCAILTRLRSLKKALAATTKKVIITERSVLTDRFVFAEMMKESGAMDPIEWQLYLNWYDTFATEIPIHGILYLTTSVAVSAERIQTRGRMGEGSIPNDYLKSLQTQHETWLATTSLPVQHLDTEMSLDETVKRIRSFIR